MEKNNKRWEKLISMPQEYEGEPSLADKAIREFENRKAQEKKLGCKVYWKKALICVASLVLLLGIGIPVYKKVTAPPPVIYYANDDLTYDEVSDMSVFIAEKNLKIGYFDVSSAQSRAGIIKETGAVALLYQKLIYVQESILDQIELNVVLQKNLTLDFYEQYFKLNETTIVNEIAVEYKVINSPNGARQVFAKFVYKNAAYYLDVTTEREPTECIGKYVEMLIG